MFHKFQEQMKTKVNKFESYGRSLTALSSPRSCRCETPLILARLMSVLVSGRLRSMLCAERASMRPAAAAGSGGVCADAANATSVLPTRPRPRLAGEAGGVGEPGETPLLPLWCWWWWWLLATTTVGLNCLEGGLTTPLPPPPPPPRRWQSAHCIRKRVTASRGRKA